MTLDETLEKYAEGVDLDQPIEELEQADEEISEVLLFDRIGWYEHGLRSYERRILEDVQDQIREKLYEIF